MHEDLDDGTVKRCKATVFVLFKVKVFHPNSGRETWQTWHLCEEHAKEFQERKGEGYFTHYHKTGEEAPVIEIQALTF